MNLEQFLQTLPYMLKGMCGVFAVTAVLILSIVLLNRFTRRKKEQKQP